jgi:hypothetical protein
MRACCTLLLLLLPQEEMQAVMAAGGGGAAIGGGGGGADGRVSALVCTPWGLRAAPATSNTPGHALHTHTHQAAAMEVLAQMEEEQLAAVLAAAQRQAGGGGGAPAMPDEALQAANPLLMLLQSLLPWVNAGAQPDYAAGDEQQGQGGGGGAGQQQ